MLEEFFKQIIEHWFASTLIGLWSLAICCVRFHFHFNEEEDERG